MLTIIGTLIGLLGSAVPEFLKIWKIKLDHQHELAILKVQADMAKSEHEYRLEEIEAQADIVSEQAVYKMAEPKYTGVKWIDGTLELLNGIIRPWLTITFTCFYGLVKYAQYKIIVASGAALWSTIWQLWNSEDMAAYMTIIGFWFGGRLMKHMLNQFGATPLRQMGNSNSIRNSHAQPTLIPVKPTEEKPKDPKPKPGEIFPIGNSDTIR